MKKMLLLGLIFLFTGLFTQPAYAQISINRPDRSIDNIGQLISAGFNLAIIFAILFVFAFLILGGYGWLTAGGDKAKVEEARTRITNAVIGLAIVASSWALINIASQFFFNEEFGTFNIPTVSGDDVPNPKCDDAGNCTI